MPTKKNKTARAVHANRGIESAYRKAMQKAIAEMTNSVEYWLKSEYKKAPPKMAAVVEQAEDASPLAAIKKMMDDLADRWIKRFDDIAPSLAEHYMERMSNASDKSFMDALSAAGWSVKFEMTPAMRESLEARIAENVGLIKSIPERYLQQVDGIVMRSYAAGRDLETMVKELRKLAPISQRRAILIARDQSNKANAITTRTRQLELGITEAIWMHSHAGKTPRPDHMAANGKRYKIAEGCLISGEYIQPGEEINCRCTSRAVLPF